MKYESQELPTDLKSLLKLAKAWGWEHSTSATGAHRLVNPKNGALAIQSANPKDFRAIKNFRAELKRGGLPPHMPPKEDKPLEEPKLVVSKVEGDSTVRPETAATFVAAPTKREQAGRGVVRDALLAILEKHDKPEGLSGEELLPLLQMQFPKMTRGNLNTTLSAYFKQGLIDKPSWGKFRAKRKTVVEVTVPPLPGIPTATAVTPGEPDDEAILDEVLMALAKLEGVVRRLKEKNKRIEEAKAALAAIK